jgi:hypothetical protein
MDDIFKGLFTIYYEDITTEFVRWKNDYERGQNFVVSHATNKRATTKFRGYLQGFGYAISIAKAGNFT